MLTAEHTERLDRLDRLASTMDSLFRIPGTGIKVGLDSIIGLIPGIGDVVALAPAGYIVASAAHMGVPKSKLMRMGFNVGIDTLIGAIPLVGDIFDIGWKGNLRNVKLLRDHVERQSTEIPLKRAA